MVQTFRIPVRGDLEAKLSYAKRKAAEKSVTMAGDTRSGSFSGMISGTYSISGGIATVAISRKPFIASWDMIESQLREFLGE